jgi:hypothetical protein
MFWSEKRVKFPGPGALQAVYQSLLGNLEPTYKSLSASYFFKTSEQHKYGGARNSMWFLRRVRIATPLSRAPRKERKSLAKLLTPIDSL